MPRLSASPGTSRLPEAAQRLVRLLPALAAFLLLGASPAADRCVALVGLSTTTLTIEAAERVSGACRVRGVARPVPASHIGFELWLPDDWNSRYYQLGNGGFAGNIDRPSLAAEAALGHAAAMTDTGHVADRFDASWAAGQPERVIDYGHRSIRATAQAARLLIEAYYGRPPRYRYYAGCSNGGRQALVAAQRYPEDWDGILAGAPANMWTRQLTSFATLQQRLRASPAGWLPPAKLPAIQRAALAACPPGTVLDGVALNPERCRFDPASLRCRGRETDTCLTPGQIESVRAIRAAGFEPTGAAIADGWAPWIVNPDPAANSQLTFATQAFRHLLQRAPTWTVAAFDPRRERVPGALQATLDSDSEDLSAFRRRGGRILSYFGWSDPLISPHRGLAYYRRVAHRQGRSQTLSFYRLFMIPGMAHCQGGEGATAFGQSLTAPSLRRESAYDIRAALEAWVERGVVPENIVPISQASAAHPGAPRSAYPLYPVNP